MQNHFMGSSVIRAEGRSNTFSRCWNGEKSWNNEMVIPSHDGNSANKRFREGFKNKKRIKIIYMPFKEFCMIQVHESLQDGCLRDWWSWVIHFWRRQFRVFLAHVFLSGKLADPLNFIKPSLIFYFIVDRLILCGYDKKVYEGEKLKC